MEADNDLNHTNEERVSIAVEKPLKRIWRHVTLTAEQRERRCQCQQDRRAHMTAEQWAKQRERQRQRDRERRQRKKMQTCNALKELTIGSKAEPDMEGQDGSEIEQKSRYMSGTTTDEQRETETREQGEQSMKTSVMKDGKQVSQETFRALACERTEQRQQHRGERETREISGTSSDEQREREAREQQQGEQSMQNHNNSVMKDEKQVSIETLRALASERIEQRHQRRRERRRQCQIERRARMSDEQVAKLKERRRQLDRERRKRKQMETYNALKEQTIGANAEQHMEGQDASEIEHNSRDMSGTSSDEQRKRERRENQQGEQSMKNQDISVMKEEKQVSQETLRTLANEHTEQRYEKQKEQRALMTVEQSAEQSPHQLEYEGEKPNQMIYEELLSQRERRCQHKRDHRSTIAEEQLLKIREQRRERDRIRRENMTQEQLLHQRERRRHCQKARRAKIQKLSAVRDTKNNRVDRPEGHVDQDQVQVVELMQQTCESESQKQCNEVQQHQLQIQKIGQSSHGAEGITDFNINIQCQNADLKVNDVHMDDGKVTDSATGEGFAMMSSGTTIHTGGCHCRHVRWQVEASSSVVAWRCNCSDCSMRANTHFIVPSAKFKLKEESEQYLTTYTFGTHTAKHIFCKVCGVTSFYIPRSNPDGIAVTFNCVDAGTLKHVEIRYFNGRHWENSCAQTSMSSFSKSEVKSLQ